eukprot:CAMPEP_0202888314 /NCGR_PEP_ID=MMETSP1391-20130828/43125_1 /ASSEMBLY_ACC=CAM_ASM_000867 /TAXON_ID=1034604 /ORGANISM="Chlamydomonas leiostraca, Strain SAG 11-49" /LENGTH=117 /DNA_ID=CAMNT_0049571615 /DNA_START=2364 /DNA_END=2715 /DNA_ORIENTATION=+
MGPHVDRVTQHTVRVQHDLDRLFIQRVHRQHKRAIVLAYAPHIAQLVLGGGVRGVAAVVGVPGLGRGFCLDLKTSKDLQVRAHEDARGQLLRVQHGAAAAAAEVGVDEDVDASRAEW